MIGDILDFVLVAVLVPLVVGETADLAPALARWLIRWGARRIGQVDQAGRYEEEWLADLDRVPGKVTKLAHSCCVLALSVPRLRAQFRQRPGKAPVTGWIVRRTAQQLAGAEEMDAALQRVAEMFVPHFADHFFIDLFQGDELIRRVQRNAGDWTPPPGTWAQVGEQIRYPEGHFCQRAMACLDTVIVTDLPKVEKENPAPSAQSLATAQQVGLKSVLVAPLYTDGTLLGVMSLAISGLTNRTERFDAGDRQFVDAVANQVLAAIDAATTAGACAGRPARPERQPEPGQRRTAHLPGMIRVTGAAS
jgi:transcriptional regulator with GAF, ATPase, and Fis domain